MGKITKQVSTINCGRVDKNPYCFLLVNKLTGWWCESHFDIFIFSFCFCLIYLRNLPTHPVNTLLHTLNYVKRIQYSVAKQTFYRDLQRYFNNVDILY